MESRVRGTRGSSGPTRLGRRASLRAAAGHHPSSVGSFAEGQRGFLDGLAYRPDPVEAGGMQQPGQCWPVPGPRHLAWRIAPPSTTPAAGGRSARRASRYFGEEAEPSPPAE